MTESEPHRRIRLESEARARQGDVKGDVCPSLHYRAGEILYCDIQSNGCGGHADGIDQHGCRTERGPFISWSDDYDDNT